MDTSTPPVTLLRQEKQFRGKRHNLLNSRFSAPFRAKRQHYSTTCVSRPGGGQRAQSEPPGGPG
eukprot:7069447-Prorocentrum_lima.AAC.1